MVNNIGRLRKLWLFFMLMIFSITVVSASPNVLNISIQEFVYEEVLFNPLGNGTGDHFDTTENQSVYILNGTITVTNLHPTEGVYDTRLTFSQFGNVTNITNSSAGGYVNLSTPTKYNISSTRPCFFIHLKNAFHRNKHLRLSGSPIVGTFL